MAKFNLDIKKISTTLAFPIFESLNFFQYASRFCTLGIMSLKVAKCGLSFPKKIPKFLTFLLVHIIFGKSFAGTLRFIQFLVHKPLVLL